jgi:putative ABC transport system ATP-binding protein
VSEGSFVSLEGVRKVYTAADLPALDHVELQIAEGEFVALMGPSGSGKSTLLTVLGAMNRPTSGRVVVDGIDVYGLGEEKRADFRHEYLGFVFQQHHLMPYLTAVENVELPLVVSTLKTRERRARALAALERVGLAGKMNRLPSELSGGEQARVAIARAVANEPPLVLADEPTGNLDSATGRSVMEMLAGLNASGHTVVVVTHDEAVAAATRRIVRLGDGRIVGDCTTRTGADGSAARPELADAHSR